MTESGSAELTTQDLKGKPERGPVQAVLLIVAITAVVLAVLTVWTVPRPTGDLYVGLAAGRDIVNGRLIPPPVDDWAFTTEGRVWVNQNWGTNLFYWISYKLGGENGLVTLKLLMLAGGATCLVLACRKRQASWAVSLIVTAGAIAAGRSFIDLRPNLTTLMFVPVMLFLLYRTEDKPRRIWLTMLIFGVVWANLHGGFTLGLAAMVFWAMCVVVLPMFGRDRLAAWAPGAAIAAAVAAVFYYALATGDVNRQTSTPARDVSLLGKIAVLLVFAVTLAVWYVLRRSMFRQGEKFKTFDESEASLARQARAQLRRKWHYFAGALGAIVLAGSVTPFGFYNLFRGDLDQLTMPFWELWNLTHPLVVTFAEDSDIWRQVIEWQSVFLASPNTFGTSWEFLTILGIFCGLVPLNVAVKLSRREPLSVEDAMLLPIIIGLCLVVVIQAYPVHEAFLKIYSSFKANNYPEVFLNSIWWQRTGWRIAVLTYPLIALATFIVAVKAVLAWVRDRKLAPCSAERIGIAVFDVCMTMGAVRMAFGSRRFMPLACMMIAPLLARRMQWLVGWLGELVSAGSARKEAPKDNKSPAPGTAAALRPVPAVLIGLALIFTISRQTIDNSRFYDTDSPIVHYDSMLKNMIVYKEFCPLARDFIQANELSGRCFNEWRWEGYLRWYRPELKAFIGGRAQQAYAIDTYKLQQSFISGRESVEALEALQVRWIIIPQKKQRMYSRMINDACLKPGAAWAPVFFDGENIILANSRLPESRAVIDRCLADKLTYPNEALHHLSKAMCLMSSGVNRNEEALKELKASHQLQPIPGAYETLRTLYGRVKVPIQSEIDYLEQENRRLAKMEWRHMGGIDVLDSRGNVLNLLGQLYQRTQQFGQITRVQQQMAEVDWLRAQAVEG